MSAQHKANAKFEGIVTLATTEQAQELVQCVDRVINKSVHIFYQMEKKFR